MNGQNAKAEPDCGAGQEPPQGLGPGRLARLAWLPIPLLLAAIIAARVAGLSGTYENDALRLVLSFTFYTLVSLGTLLLIGRSFLASGAPGLLLLECGVVLWSLAGTVGDLVDHGDANINVTIFNTGILLAGLCHLAGAILSLRPQRPLRPTPVWLTAAFALALGSLGLVTWAALAHRLPVFFIPGQGGTTVRYGVLLAAIAMFVLSAVLLYASQRTARSPFASWYALALLLLAVGLFGIMIQLSLWGVVNWLSRTAQWLGGFYLLLAALAALGESHLPLLPLGERSRPALYRHALAVVTVLAAAAVRLVFLSALGTHAPFVVFYPAVMVAALYGGWRAGLLATALSAVLADYFWIEPIGRLALGQPADWLGLAIFLLTGAMITGISEAMHRAGARASAAETQALLAAEREAAAEALRLSEEKFVLAFANNPAAIALTRLDDGRFLEVNETWLALNGYGRDEVIGLSARQLPIWPSAEAAGRFLEELRESGSLHGWEQEFLKKSGEVYVAQLSAQLLTVRGEKLVLSTLVDVTKRKRAEEALRKSEQEFRSLAEAVPQIVWATRPDGWNIYFNQQWVDYTGLTLDESYGHGWNTPFHPEDKQRAWDAWQRATQHGDAYLLECRLRRADGVYRWWLIHGTPLRDADGQIQKWLGTCTDIEELKQAEEVLRRAKAAAEAANQAKSQFLANMSHELRTPMNAILGMIDVALPKAADPAVQDCLQTARESADLLLTLLDDLLDSARIESGKLELESAPFSLRRMLDQMTRVLAVRASEKGLCFCCRMPEDTPDAVVGDRMRLQQVLLNLAGNAVKFTDRGEVEVSLHALSQNGEACLDFTVRDTGIGIPPAGLERLFQPFTQADASMARRFGGTGLGLSICKSLVEMMGGRIWAESGLGQGSTFHVTVRLPLAKELPAGPDAPAVVATPASVLRVLLVEDNPANQKLAAYVLQDRGHAVEIAEDGQEALDLTGRNRYDVILMDVQMPGMDGLEATAAIRKREDGGSRVPIIAMTAHAMKGDRQRCLAAGMDGYLPKPIDANEMIALVESLAGSAAREALDAPRMERG